MSYRISPKFSPLASTAQTHHSLHLPANQLIYLVLLGLLSYPSFSLLLNSAKATSYTFLCSIDCCASTISTAADPGTRGRGEVLGQAGVEEASAYTLEGVSKNQKSKITTNSSNSTTPLLVPIFSPSPEYARPYHFYS